MLLIFPINIVISQVPNLVLTLQRFVLVSVASRSDFFFNSRVTVLLFVVVLFRSKLKYFANKHPG